MASDECPEALKCCLSRDGGREDGPVESLNDYLGCQEVQILGDDPHEEEECIVFMPPEEEQEAMRRLDWVIEHRLEACWDDWLEYVGNSTVGVGSSTLMTAVEEEACRHRWSRVLAERSPPRAPPRGWACGRTAALPLPPAATILASAPQVYSGEGAASSSVCSAAASVSSTRCASVSPHSERLRAEVGTGTSTPPVGTSTAAFTMQTPLSVTTVVAPRGDTPLLSEPEDSDLEQVGLLTPVSVITERLEDMPDVIEVAHTGSHPVCDVTMWA
mmetsp:Transcript_130723/g.326145  ORF Transcript_130723/g.326145 Transcript_130723/m.326145 type:complete len:273 (+) Transcript_130723:76-894(+)